MSIQTQVQIEELQRKVAELSPMISLVDLEKRISDLEAKYKMLNARVGWNKERAA